MGSNVSRTDDYPLSGILVPHRWAVSAAELADDYALGTDYTEADAVVGAVTTDATTRPRISLIADGTPDTGVTQLEVRAVAPGVPQPGDASCAVVYRRDNSDTWHGADRYTTVTGYQAVQATVVTGVAHAIRALRDGTVSLVYTQIFGGTAEVYRMTRSTAGVWSSASLVASYASSTYTWSGIALCVDPTDTGTGVEPLLMYTQWVTARSGGTTIACFRSTDGGSTWTLQNADCCGAITTTAGIRVLCADRRAGEVVLCATLEAGTSSAARQYLSADGGYTFELIYGPTARSTIWDIAGTPGGWLIVAVEYDSTNDRYAVRRGSLGRSLFLAQTASPDVEDVCDHYAGACFAQTADGRVVLLVSGTSTTGSAAGHSVVDYVTTDYGSTWTEATRHGWGPNEYPGLLRAAEVRGQLIIVSTQHTVAATSYDGRLYEERRGGASDATVTQDAAATDLVWWPHKTLTDDGWTITDTGTVTRTRSRTLGELIEVAAASSSVSTRSYAGPAEIVAAGRWVARCVSGSNLTLIIKGGALAIAIDLTTTQIRAYEDGTGPGSWTDHGAGSSYLDIHAIIDPDIGEASVWYRTYTNGSEREYTLLETITGATTGTGTAYLSVEVGASTDAYVLLACAGQSGTLGAIGADGLTSPAELDGIRLSSTRYTYLGAGLSVTARGGPMVIDGSTWTIPITSTYRKAAMLPHVEPSPRRPWRSSSGAAQTIRLTPDYMQGGTSYLTSQLIGVYLDGLVGVGQIGIYDTSAGSVVQTIDLRTAFSYELSGHVVRPAMSGAAAEGPWLQPHEAAGWYFVDAGGKARRVRSNSGGSLESGATETTARAALELEDIDGTETASGTGYLFPSRAMVHLHVQAWTALEQLRLVLSAHTEFSYKQIGILAAGPVHVIGRGFDRQMGLEVAPGQDVVTLPDGSRYAVSRRSRRRRLEVAVADSHVDIADVWSAGASPDYVIISDASGAHPAAARHGAPVLLEGALDAADGAPIVLLPRITYDSTGQSNKRAFVSIFRRCDGAIYGRVVNSYRRTQVPMGVTMRSDGWRVSTITVEEEL